METTYIDIEDYGYLESDQEKERRFSREIIRCSLEMRLKYGSPVSLITMDTPSYYTISEGSSNEVYFMGRDLLLDRNIIPIIQSDPYLHFILSGDGFEESFYVNVDRGRIREKSIDELLNK